MPFNFIIKIMFFNIKNIVYNNVLLNVPNNKGYSFVLLLMVYN